MSRGELLIISSSIKGRAIDNIYQLAVIEMLSLILVNVQRIIEHWQQIKNNQKVKNNYKIKNNTCRYQGNPPRSAGNRCRTPRYNGGCAGCTGCRVWSIGTFLCTSGCSSRNCSHTLPGLGQLRATLVSLLLSRGILVEQLCRTNCSLSQQNKLRRTIRRVRKLLNELQIRKNRNHYQQQGK